MRFRINDAENAVVFYRFGGAKRKKIIDRESNATVHQIETRISTRSSDSVVMY